MLPLLSADCLFISGEIFFFFFLIKRHIRRCSRDWSISLLFLGYRDVLSFEITVQMFFALMSLSDKNKMCLLSIG